MTATDPTPPREQGSAQAADVPPPRGEPALPGWPYAPGYAEWQHDPAGLGQYPPVGPTLKQGRVLAITAAVLVLVTVVVVGTIAFRNATWFTVQGTITALGSCSPHHQVNVYDDSGVLLATALMDDGTPSYGSKCVYHVSIKDVPTGHSGYVVRTLGWYSEAMSKDQVADLALIAPGAW